VKICGEDMSHEMIPLKLNFLKHRVAPVFNRVLFVLVLVLVYLTRFSLPQVYKRRGKIKAHRFGGI
jgi:hypothetical protein